MMNLTSILERLVDIRDNYQKRYWRSLVDQLNKINTSLSGDKKMGLKNSNKEKSAVYEIIEFIRSMFTAMLLALLIRTFFLQPFNIPSESMLPNLLVGDYLFVSKYAYGYSNYSFPFAPYLFNDRILFSEPKRGDVAVFRVVDDGNKDYIKRIVGLPGDKITFKSGSVVVNGKPSFVTLNGNYGHDTIDPETIGAKIVTERLDKKAYQTLDVFETPYDNTQEFTVPAGHYFFAGDNRDNSQDSRFMSGPVGFVPRDRLIGKAEFIFFSIRDASFFEFWKWPMNIRFDRFFKKIN